MRLFGRPWYLVSSLASSISPQQPQNRSVMTDILARVRAINQWPSDLQVYDFCVNGIALGKVRPQIAQKLAEEHSDVFVLQQEKEKLVLNLHPRLSTPHERTQAVNGVFEQWRDEKGLVPGWRHENYPIAASFYDKPLLEVERAAIGYLGCLEYGVHINGLVSAASANNDKEHSKIKMWMARRSPTKSKYPGMLDHIVAGGQASGLGLIENVRKECLEEAGIPPDLVDQGLAPAGAISYQNYDPQTEMITRAVMYNFDLTLPESFVPQPVDGEVQEFFTWTVEDLLQSMALDYQDPIKPNCYVVIIDWLLRQGHLSPEEPGYLDVLRELRSGDCQ